MFVLTYTTELTKQYRLGIYQMAQQKNYLVTGATSGLGLALAQKIAQADPTNMVIVGARRPSEASILRQMIPVSQLTLMELDTSSLASVKRFAKDVLGSLNTDTLTGLSLNAGVQIVSGDYFSVDGFELTFATNVLGHIALFQELAPVLSPTTLVVSTASGTHDKNHKLAKPYNFFGGYFPSAQQVAAGNVSQNSDKAQLGRDRYATSKLCNILFTYGMARRYGLTGPRFMAYDPGLMPGTELVRDNTAAVRFAWKNILPTAARLIDGASTIEKSGDMLAQLLLGQHLPTGTGQYVEFTGKEISSSEMSHNEALQDALLTWANDTITSA